MKSSIREELSEYITEHATDLDLYMTDEVDLHHRLFNEDYYIIGYYQAEQWLVEDGKNNFNNSQNMTFDVLGYVTLKS